MDVPTTVTEIELPPPGETWVEVGYWIEAYA